jgi:hypothetical protein
MLHSSKNLFPPPTFESSISIICSYGTVPQKVEFPFPLYINKFLEKAEMDSNNFFLRWKNLDKPGQECQKIFAAKYPMNHDDIRQKVNFPSKHLIKSLCSSFPSRSKVLVGVILTVLMSMRITFVVLE